MSKKSREKNQKFLIKILQESGWTKTEKGEAFGVAELEYNNDEMILQVDHLLDNESIAFRLFSNSQELFLIIKFEDSLREIINKIINIQDDIAVDNCKVLLKQLISICPEIYVDTGEELIPLVDE
jgi:hypothetical protein